MEFRLSLVAINVCGALGIGIIALVYKIQTINQSKRVRRLRERLQASVLGRRAGGSRGPRTLPAR